MSGRILVIADDYGLNAGVSQAIRMLAAARRITGTCALVNLVNWPTDATSLRELSATTAVGLHLNFTLGAPLSPSGAFARAGSFPGRSKLIAAALSHQLDSSAVYEEICRQCEAFETGFGAPPDFVDGHEHAHVLPSIRGTLLSVLAKRYPARAILVRDPSPTSGKLSLKALVLRRLARHMRRDCTKAGFICNDAFGGVTDFAANRDAVDGEFRRAAGIGGWLPLVMCHPGFASATIPTDDALAQRRQYEFDSLMSASSPLAVNAWHAVRTSAGVIDWPRTTPSRAA